MEPRSIVYITAEVVVGVVSVVGNSVVLAAILRTRQLHTVTNVFVGNLAAADILVGLLVAPCAALSYKGLPRDFYGCMLINSLILLFTNVSIFMLLAVALERFLAIKEPYVYQRLMTVRRAIVINLAVWLLGTLLGLMPMYGWNSGRREIKVCQFTDVITYEYMVYFQFFGLVLLPLFLMLCIYMYILVIVRRHMRQTNALHRQFQHNNPSGAGGDVRENRTFNKDVRAAKMFALVILLFGLFWLPVNIFNCISLFCGPRCKFPIESLLAAIVMSHANSSINPFLYAASNSRIKKAIKRLFGAVSSQSDSSSDMGHRSNNAGGHRDHTVRRAAESAREQGDIAPDALRQTEGGTALATAQPHETGKGYNENNTAPPSRPENKGDDSSSSASDPPRHEDVYTALRASAQGQVENTGADDVYELQEIRSTDSSGKINQTRSTFDEDNALFKRTFSPPPSSPPSPSCPSPNPTLPAILSTGIFNRGKDVDFHDAALTKEDRLNLKSDTEIYQPAMSDFKRRNSFPKFRRRLSLRNYVRRSYNKKHETTTGSSHSLRDSRTDSSHLRNHSNHGFTSDGEVNTDFHDTDRHFHNTFHGNSKNQTQLINRHNTEPSRHSTPPPRLGDDGVSSPEDIAFKTINNETVLPYPETTVIPVKTVNSIDSMVSLRSPSLCVEVEESGLARNTRTEHTKL